MSASPEPIVIATGFQATHHAGPVGAAALSRRLPQLGQAALSSK
jgi:hypothetical protein